MNSNHDRPCFRHPLLILMILTLVAAATVSLAAQETEQELYSQEIEAWRQDRVDRLTAEDGWLTLVGLFWLNEGKNPMGSEGSNTVILPAGKAPPYAGAIYLSGQKLRLEAEPSANIVLQGESVSTLPLLADTQGEPTILETGNISFYVIERDKKFAVRVKDPSHPARGEFRGIDYYPVSADWKVAARFEAHIPPKEIPIPTEIGTISHQVSSGAVVFEVDGQELRLDVLAEPGAEELFIIFADQTTGAETYGGGRYVYAPAPDENGTVLVDFNKAYNPPCVFTSFATCPLPPRQNRLPVRVEAGEKVYRKAG
ncbi:MAG: DUF1684 domain-containing protein [Thermoanaerobaculia bacterium]